MEMRDFLTITGKMCDWRAAIGMCRKSRRAVWVDLMVAKFGRPTRIP